MENPAETKPIQLDYKYLSRFRSFAEASASLKKDLGGLASDQSVILHTTTREKPVSDFSDIRAIVCYFAAKQGFRFRIDPPNPGDESGIYCVLGRDNVKKEGEWYRFQRRKPSAAMQESPPGDDR